MIKVLINGSSLNEIAKEKISDRTYDTLESAIGHIKRNKRTYKTLILAVAIFMDAGTISMALEVLEGDGKLSKTLKPVYDRAYELLKIMVEILQLGCMGGGLKKMAVTISNGGDVKEAIYQSLWYWGLSVFIEYYTTLF